MSILESKNNFEDLLIYLKNFIMEEVKLLPRLVSEII